jgi:hypothetical protein
MDYTIKGAYEDEMIFGQRLLNTLGIYEATYIPQETVIWKTKWDLIKRLDISPNHYDALQLGDLQSLETTQDFEGSVWISQLEDVEEKWKANITRDIVKFPKDQYMNNSNDGKMRES